MEVFRLPPYPITTTWDVPLPSTQYSIYIEDLVDHSFENIPVTSNAESKIEYIIPRAKAQYDRKFLFRVTDTTNEIVIDSNLDVLRPYIDPAMLATSGTATEYKEYKMLELLARSIIDSIISDGFYNNKHIIQAVGQGTDYFSLWEDTNRVLKVYENNVLVYDIDAEDPLDNEFTYLVTLDNSAIQRVMTDVYNRQEYNFPKLPTASSDIGFVGYAGVAFPAGVDYTFILDTGYKAIPPDIEYATELLINDIKCGKLEYFKRYISAYNTDQFKVEFNKAILDGTGNIFVDKILSKYMKSIVKPGVI